ncbi:hypothetical protein G9A89_022865 [Geosiphon pyriformis]|nr:hypothetical protein G9A89_022865 [Geosiphon pyriformis]
MFYDKFCAAVNSSNLDSMWNALRQVMCLSAESVFRKKWFKDYNSVFNKASSRFHNLELLVSKIVKTLYLVSHEKFVSLLDLWSSFDSANVFVVKSLFLSGFYFDTIWSALARIRKSYHLSKLSELECARESYIRSAIDKRMESFELNKGYTIRSVLEHPFHKVVLDHLVVGDELILESNSVKSKPLEYVFDEAFSGMMCSIGFDELFRMVSGLPDNKAAGFSAGLSSFFAAGAFVNDTIWVGSSQTATQHILNVATLVSVGPLSVCNSSGFMLVCARFFQVSSDSLFVFTNGFLNDLDLSSCQAGAAVFFENIDLGLSVGVCGLVSSTLAELQTIALALECVPASHSVCLFLDSQMALDAWNEHANSLADAASFFGWYLPLCVDEHFLLVEGSIVSGNSRYFVRDIFCAVCYAHWEIGSGSSFLASSLHLDVD